VGQRKRGELEGGAVEGGGVYEGLEGRVRGGRVTVLYFTLPAYLAA